MKRVAIIASLFVTALASAQAATFNDQARVRRVEPQYENISVPRNECRSQWITEERDAYQRQDPNYGGLIIGGVAGGVSGQPGRQGPWPGSGDGRRRGGRCDDRQLSRRPEAAANTLRRAKYVQREVQTCRTVYDNQSRVTGYRVSYEYMRPAVSHHHPDRPGPRPAVRVSVDPMNADRSWCPIPKPPDRKTQ